MPEPIDRQEGRRLFGLNPPGYDDSRPDYPEWIFECLRDHGALVPGTATLEIGAGTGRATRKLLEYGADPLTIIEPDERFAVTLETVTDASSAKCSVKHEPFEEAELESEQFSLIAAATSFHWIEPIPGLRRVRRLLERDGVGALFWNVFQDLDKEDPFHEATASLLSQLAVSPSGSPETIPYALDREARVADAHAAGFGRVDYFESRWTLVLDTERVGKLYEGFSHIQRLDPASRADLLARLMKVADSEFNGRVERNITSCLYLLA